MNKVVKAALRHRAGLGELGVLAFILIGAGFSVLSLGFGDDISSTQRLGAGVLLALGMLVAAALGFFAWRRFVEQEQEIRQRVAAEDRARFLAHHDHLTGLPNRRQLQQALNAALASPPRNGRAHAIFLLDLNGFKKVNDVYGHARGDEVLSEVAGRMATALGSGDLLARTGGDEFAIVLRDIAELGGAEAVAATIIKSLEEPLRIGADQHQVGTGVGIALVPRDGFEASELLRKADIALYRAKAQQGDAFAFFSEKMDEDARAKHAVQRDLASAIGSDAIVPHYQPIVDLKTGEVHAFEALARWTHPTLGQIPPNRFIPLAEESGLIRRLSYHLLQIACSDARCWPEHIGLSFNISPWLLQDGSLGSKVLEIVNASGLAPSRLELEITENAIVGDLDAARHALGALREAGVRIALDDFGTGSTSLFHLRTFKFDAIKIDRGFVDAMLREEESAEIVKAILGLGKGLNVPIVAEGVEETDQCAALQEQGCKHGQGYLFSRAVPAAETAALLQGGSGRLSDTKAAA